MKYWFGFGCGVVATIIGLALFSVEILYQQAVDVNSISEYERHVPPPVLKGPQELPIIVDSLPSGWRIA